MEKNIKNYDLSPLNDFFNISSTPLELDNKLTELMYNYASCVNSADECFRRDVSTLYCLHEILVEIARLSEETNI